MVVDGRENDIRRAPDVRRWVALRAYGTMRFLNFVQAGFEDIEGAIGAGQYGVAALQARHVALVCLSIRSLALVGEITFNNSISFDFFAGLDPDEVAAALSLANEALDINESTATRWLERFQAYVAETERLLGYDRTLPVLRSPEGAFGLVSLARRWIPILDELGLPTLLPSHWGPSDATER